MYDKNCIQIGNPEIRKQILEENPYCAICGSNYMIACHHHYKKKRRYLNENYIIDLPECLSVLCNTCHSIIHTDENQYNRRIWGHSHNGRMCWKDFDYWHEGKDGRGFAEIVEEHLKESKTNES